MEFFEVKLDLDKNGYLDSKYGGNASKEFLDSRGLPGFSPEIAWEEVSEAKSYALEIIDYDSSPVVGKIYIHWVVGNITSNKLEENASTQNRRIIQGVNSATEGIVFSEISEDKKQASNIASSNYIGPMPPNKDHHYLVNVYALDVAKLDLKIPFFISDLHDAMRGHILAIGRKEFKYTQVKR